MILHCIWQEKYTPNNSTLVVFSSFIPSQQEKDEILWHTVFQCYKFELAQLLL